MAVVAWAGLALGLLNLTITVINLRQQQPNLTVKLTAKRRRLGGGSWDLYAAEIIVITTSRQAVTLDDLTLDVFLDGDDSTKVITFSAFDQGPTQDRIFDGRPERRIEGYDALTLNADLTALRQLTRLVTDGDAVAIQAEATRHKRRSRIPGQGSTTATYRSTRVEVEVPDR